MSDPQPDRSTGTGYHLKSAWGNALPYVSKPLQAAYRKWYDSLTDEQLAQLGGRPHPANPTSEVTPIFKDHLHIEDRDDQTPTHRQPTEHKSVYHILSTERDPSDITEGHTNHESLPAILVLEIVRKVLHAWTSAPDRSTRLHGEVLGIALGIPGETVSSLARKYGCTRQAISKRHRSIVKALSLPPTTRMVLGRTKAAKVLHQKNIALPTRRKRRKASPPTPNPQ